MTKQNRIEKNQRQKQKRTET